jgi:hypothetical protein
MKQSPESPTQGDQKSDRIPIQDDYPKKEGVSLQYILELARQSLMILAGLMAAALASFLFTGGFSWEILSERIFWAAMIPMAIGAFGSLSIVVTGGTLSATRILKPEQAKAVLDGLPDLRRRSDQRYDFSIQMWVIGMVCVGISALVQTVGAALAK